MSGKSGADAMATGTTSGTPQVLLAHHLKQLKLPTVLREYDKVARECAREGVDHPRYLLRLIELELIDRERRTIERRIKAARFPAVKSLDTFDFTAIASLNKMLVLELARCEFILRRENVIALGNCQCRPNFCGFRRSRPPIPINRRPGIPISFRPAFRFEAGHFCVDPGSWE